MKTESGGRNGEITYYGPWGASSTGPVPVYRHNHQVIRQVTGGDFKTPNPLHFVGSKAYGMATATNGMFYTNVYGWFSSGSYGTVISMLDAYDGHSSATGLAPGSGFPELLDKAMEDAYSAIRGKANIAVDVAEWRETKKMLLNFVNVRKNIIKFLEASAHQVKGRRKRGSAARRRTRGQALLDTGTSAWLGTRYGVMPLVYSTYDLMETLNAKLHKLRPDAASGRASSVREGSTTYPSNTIGYPGVWSVTEKLHEKVSVEFYIAESNWDSIWDFTSLNPLSIAWEVVPLSFVADWFVNVADTLSLWENYFIYTGRLSGPVTITMRYKQYRTDSYLLSWSRPAVIDLDGFTPEQQTSGYSISGGHRQSYQTQRTVQYDLPAPSGIRIKPVLNSKRFLDAASLIHGVFGKGSR